MTGDPTPSERAGQLTAAERERLAKHAAEIFGFVWAGMSGEPAIAWHEAEEDDRQLWRDFVVLFTTTGPNAVLHDHPRDETGERGAAIARATDDLLMAAWEADQYLREIAPQRYTVLRDAALRLETVLAVPTDPRPVGGDAAGGGSHANSALVPH